MQLDRERILFFNAEATYSLYSKYGQKFWSELLVPGEKQGDAPTLRSLDALKYFLWAGLKEDAERNGEALPLERVSEFIRPMSINTLVSALSIALVMQNYAPAPEGKAEAVTARPAAAASESRPKPRRSTSKSASVSRSASSAGRRKGSGSLRSRN